MIPLNRLRQDEPFFVNADHIARIEQHHDTHVHLFGGAEYVVTDDPADIVARIIDYRGRVLAIAERVGRKIDEDFR